MGGRDYLPIADHGLIGDLHTAALVGAEGTIDWWCCPRFDSPSVFGAVLDRERGGFYRIAPVDENPVARQLYVPDAAVLVTRFLTPSAAGEVTDFMPVEHERQLVRQVACVRGEMRFRVEIEPRFDYGRAAPDVNVREDGAVFRSPGLSLSLRTAARLQRTDGGARGELTLEEGESASFVLEQGDTPRPHSEEETRAALDSTIAYWRRWLARSSYRGRWREQVHRSALTLKLLTFRPTGAIVAAPTTSLPERIGGGRNWDYRYTWIRDASFSLDALLRLGFTEEAEAFMGWLAARFRESAEGESGPLRIMYGIDGRADLEEFELDHLEGHQGSAPVRIGNGAAGQLQLDIYGELLDFVHRYDECGAPIGREAWADLLRTVEWVCENWDRADEGIWEVRGGRRQFTYSRLQSWVALERAVGIARRRSLPGDLEGWQAVAGAIRGQILERGWSERRGAFVQHYETDALDASVLLMPLVGFIAPTDPRWLSTLDAISQELVADGLVHRYLAPDGLEGGEGSFSICSFWYVEALALAGRIDAARLVFEILLTYANHLGLYSEEIGRTGEALGNFPQAFTHLALIKAALTLDRRLG